MPSMVPSCQDRFQTHSSVLEVVVVATLEKIEVSSVGNIVQILPTPSSGSKPGEKHKLSTRTFELYACWVIFHAFAVVC